MYEKEYQEFPGVAKISEWPPRGYKILTPRVSHRDNGCGVNHVRYMFFFRVTHTPLYRHLPLPIASRQHIMHYSIGSCSAYGDFKNLNGVGTVCIGSAFRLFFLLLLLSGNLSFKSSLVFHMAKAMRQILSRFSHFPSVIRPIVNIFLLAEDPNHSHSFNLSKDISVDPYLIMYSSILFFCFAPFFVKPCLCHNSFDSRDPVVRSVIELCRNQTSQDTSDCYDMLRCIFDRIPSDFLARWSAGSSILAFIPTIILMMSNSINEITTVADQSVVFAVTLSLTSITTFNLRFWDFPSRLPDIIFERQKWDFTRAETALSLLAELRARSRKSRPWWQSSQMQIYALSILVIASGAGIWYEVYEVTRYGIVVFACPIKLNIGIWVGLSQLLVLLNVLCRSILFDIHTIHITTGEDTRPRGTLSAPPVNIARSSIMLRSLRNTRSRWLLQSGTEVFGFVLYAYGTTLLASMTLIPAHNAIEAMMISTISVGFGRFALHSFTSLCKRGGQLVVIDIPADCARDFTASILELTLG